MKKGDFLFFDDEKALESSNVMFLEDLGEGLFLGAKPDWRSVNVYTVKYTGESRFNIDWKQEDIDYCLENFSYTQLSKIDFLKEINKYKMYIKNYISDLLNEENIFEPYTFDDLCIAAITIKKNMFKISLYESLMRLQNIEIDESLINIYKIYDNGKDCFKYTLYNKHSLEHITSYDFYKSEIMD